MTDRQSRLIETASVKVTQANIVEELLLLACREVVIELYVTDRQTRGRTDEVVYRIHCTVRVVQANTGDGLLIVRWGRWYIWSFL